MMTNNITSEETSKILSNDKEICSVDEITKTESTNKTKSLNESKSKHVAFSDVDTNEKKTSKAIPEEIQDDKEIKVDADYINSKEIHLEKLPTNGLDTKLELKPETTEEVETELERHSSNQSSKVSGYLGKKGRLRMVSSWKKYWFILEGRLLLYYRSKAEYDTLSPCKGSITLRSPCNIKPGSASNCVFQLEMRNHTITLRAENRADQDKWMIAILGALKQTQSTNRMSHFRYSADDLAVRTKADNPPALIRQNTLPDRVSLIGDKPSTPRIKTMVERIESIGGQSYIGGQTLHTPESIKPSKASPKLPKNTQLKKLLDKQMTDEASGEGEWVHEEVEMVNDLYATVDVPKDRHIYHEISVNAHIEPEVIVENSNYEEMDVNRNKIEEYWEPLYDSRAIYADVELFQPVLPPRPKSQEPTDNLKTETKSVKTTKMRKRQSFVYRIFNRIKRHENPKEDEKGQKEEFKVNKPENDDKCVNDSSSEEEKTSIQDSIQNGQVPELNEHGAGTDLSPMVVKELSNIIHAKVAEEENVAEEEKPLDEPCQDQNPDEIKTEAETRPLDHFCQLQQPQIPLLTNQHSQPDPAQTEEISQCTESTIDTVNGNDFHNNRLYNLNNRLNIPRPKLICKPKRHKRIKDVCEDQLTTGQYYPNSTDSEQVVPHFKEDDNKLVTIEKILDDLEYHNYKPFSRQKVKDLVEKFNEHEVDEDGKVQELIHVQLRHKHPEQTQELSSLLEELSKVANSPVSPRNISIGHNGPFSEEEEWAKIIPLRKRRHSDPDYDIPRPHSALLIIPNNDKEETKMQPTRFFGPVIIEQLNGDTSCGTSITPDSLEIDVLNYQAKNYTPSIEEDRSMRSYTSHIYASSDSHLNNTCTLNSHHHQNSNADGDNLTNEGTVDDILRPPTLSSLIEPKTECKQAFCLKEDNDKNNNVSILYAVENEDTHEACAAPCFDSLEPTTVTTQE